MMAGRLRHRVDIESVTESQTASGQVTRSWSLFEPVWANIGRVSGNEYVQGETQIAEATHKIECRYLAGVTPKMRVNFNGRIFNILSVANVDERGIRLEMITKEAV